MHKYFVPHRCSPLWGHDRITPPPNADVTWAFNETSVIGLTGPCCRRSTLFLTSPLSRC